MKTLYTVTLNPTVDLSLHVPRLVPFEKNAVSRQSWEPGGGGINAARIIHRLGRKVVAISFAGGEIGQRLRRLLKAEKIPTRWLTLAGNTRINISISNEQDHQQTRLSLKGEKVSPREWALLLRELGKIPAGSLVVWSGSVPPGISLARVKSALRGLTARGIGVMLDVPGETLGGLLKAAPFFVKPNLVEFQKLTGTRARRCGEIIRLVRQRLPQIPLVCVSSVEGGALLISREHAWFGKIPPIRLRSTVGAGDSMVGAIACEVARLELYRYEGPDLQNQIAKVGEHLMRHGLAAAAATLVESGTELGRRRDMLRFRPKIRVRRITP